MPKPTTNYLFHVPMTNKILDYEQLESQMQQKKRRPDVIHVIDANTKKRIGSMNPFAALAKFR